MIVTRGLGPGVTIASFGFGPFASGVIAAIVRQIMRQHSIAGKMDIGI